MYYFYFETLIIISQLVIKKLMNESVIIKDD